MAWIKMRTALARDPDVIQIGQMLNLDEYAVVGRLHTFWSWAFETLRNGDGAGVTVSWINRYVHTEGFGEALQKVGWLEIKKAGINIPKFEVHMSQDAKNRALTQRRNVTFRQRKRDAPSVTVPSQKTSPEVEVDVEEEVPPICPPQVHEVFDYWKANMQPKARPLKDALSKIKTRLGTFSVDELKQAMDNAKRDDFFVEKNLRRGAKWLFATDSRVEEFLNWQQEVTACPSCGGAGAVEGDAYRCQECKGIYGGSDG